MTNTIAEPNTTPTPAHLKARNIGVWAGLIMGVPSALTQLGSPIILGNVGWILSVLLVFFVAFVMFGGLTFVISWIVISAWRNIRR